MTVSYRIEGDLVEITVVGDVTVDDVLGQLLASAGDPALEPPAHLLLNVTESELVPPKEEVHRITVILREVHGRMGGRIAILVAHPVRFGLARQISAHLDSEGIAVMPFTEREQARQWLQGYEVS